MTDIVIVIVSAVLWLAAALCVPSALRKRRRSLLGFLAVFALTMTLQPQPVYDRVDAWLGGENITYFLFHALAIVAVALLDVIVQEAVGRHGLSPARIRATALVAGGIVAAQAVLFFPAPWRLTDTISQSFMSRWDYTAYASTTWLAMAVFAVSVASACLADVGRQRRTVTRISLGFVIFGCLGVLVYALISLTSAVQSALSPQFVFQGWPRVVLTLALLLAPISLAVGLGLTITVDTLAAVNRDRQNRRLLWRITPLWTRLLSDSPELSIEQQLGPIALIVVRAPGDHLYRRHVEIRDSLLLNPSQTVSTAEQALIDQAERQTRAGTDADADADHGTAPDLTTSTSTSTTTER